MIQTKVARIISPTEVVLAAGSDDDVTPGMEFVIYELSDTVYDPENGEDLGRIELVKGRVIAEHVQDKFTIARTPARQVERTFDPMAAYALAASAFLQRRTIRETVHDQLKVEGAAPIVSDPVVRVGDRVRSVSEAMPIRRMISA